MAFPSGLGVTRDALSSRAWLGFLNGSKLLGVCLEASVKSRANMLWLFCLYGIAVLAFAGGAAVGHALDQPRAVDPNLVTLLRFMALIKLGMASGAVGLTHWRLRYPAAGLPGAGYIASASLMVGAPGLIWSMGTVVAGAVLFHTGLFSFLLLAWADRSGRETAIGEVFAHRRRRQQTEP